MAATLAVAFLTVVVMFTLAGSQATGETAGERFLGRIGGALIEVDRWVPAHRESIDALARERPDSPLPLPDFPMEVLLPAEAAIGATDGSLRDAVMQGMGATLYREGSSAIQDEEGESNLSMTDPVRWSVNMLNQNAHSFWQFSFVISALVLLAVCGGLIWMRQWPFVALAIGGGVAAGLSLAAWIFVQVMGASVGSAVDREIALVLRDGAWIGLRNGLAMLVIGLGAAFLMSMLMPAPRTPGTGPSDGGTTWEDEWYEEEPEFEPLDILPRRPPRASI